MNCRHRQNAAHLPTAARDEYTLAIPAASIPASASVPTAVRLDYQTDE